MHRVLRLLSATSLVWLGLVLPGLAQTSPDQAQKFQAVTQKISEIRKLIAAKKYPEAGKVFSEAQAALGALKAEELTKTGEAAVRSNDLLLSTMRKQLEGKGVTIAAAPTATTTPANPAGTPATTTPAGQISFVRDVAPMLSGKCGRCHMGNMSKGGFNASTFTSLMAGANGVKVVTPKDGKGSRIYEVIESGDMPRGGGKVSPTELAALVKWIDAGATFDGPNANAPLNTIPGVTPAKTPPATLVKATGNEKISFSRDIAPVLATTCTGCHGDQNPSGNLGFTDFQKLLRGGDSGAIVKPGDPAASVLVKRIKGLEEARMPLRRPALADDVIAKFELWIKEGAKFDGPDPKMDTEMVAAVYKAKHATHEDLAKDREGLAKLNWRKGNPDTNSNQIETDSFLIVGNVIPSRLEEIARQAEDVQKKLAATFKANADEPLFRGKLTLFIFSKRFEYSEFGQMVEAKQLPTTWRGHWFYNVVDAYACLAPPSDDQDTMDRLLVEVMAGAYIESQGNAPRWFSQGVGRAMSAQLNPKNPTVKMWDERIPLILSGADPAGLINGDLGLENGPIVAYGFGKGMLSQKGQFQALMTSLRNGTDFDAAFQQAFRTDPRQAVTAWARSAAKK